MGREGNYVCVCGECFTVEEKLGTVHQCDKCGATFGLTWVRIADKQKHPFPPWLRRREAV